VPLENAERFAQAMHAAGNDCELVTYPGEDHGFFNHGRGDGSAYADTLRRGMAFLERRGYLARWSLGRGARGP
jgi:dipeptidyl aminopeptidase/acylaminoacyl peptidase